MMRPSWTDRVPRVPALHVTRAALLVTPAALLALAGCGSSSHPGSTSSTARSPSAPAAATAVRDASNSSLGKTILVDGAGRTLYVLVGETATHLLCASSGCLSIWPLLSTHAGAVPPVPLGLQGPLAVLSRPGGAEQVTVLGRPLYTYSGDSSSGEANGEGIATFGGIWEAVASSGEPIKHAESAAHGGY